MTERKCLILDDVAAALTLMTDSGKDIASGPANQVREAVLAYAKRRNWTVVPYHAYVDWAIRVADDDDQLLVLDPLFPIPILHQKAEPFRISRVGVGYQFKVGDFSPFHSFRRFGILDDAASSGATLEFALQTAQQAGSHVGLFAVCASSAVARTRIQRRAPSAKWREYITGDWIILHLRDGCPHLPFAGRRVGQLVGEESEAELEVRVHPADLPGTPWASLCVIQPIRKAVESARAILVERLSRFLDRPAVVADLRALGADVPALIRPGQEADYTSRLDALLPPL